MWDKTWGKSRPYLSEQNMGIDGMRKDENGNSLKKKNISCRVFRFIPIIES